MQNLTILFFQSDLVWEKPHDNIENFNKKIRKNFKGEDLIVLPETFTTGFPVDPAPFAVEKNGFVTDWMKQTAAKTGAVITGSFLLKEEDKYFNSLLWVTPEGNVERYDKRHVFSMGGEDKKITKGNKLITVNLKGWRIRPFICYDLRFPVWCKNRYSDDKGFEYDLAIFVANWPSQRSYPWEMLLKARAMENQSFVLGVNRVGHDGIGNYYSGNSMMIDAKGNIVSQAEPGNEVAISTEISMEELTAFRKKFNVGRDWDNFTLIID